MILIDSLVLLELLAPNATAATTRALPAHIASYGVVVEPPGTTVVPGDELRLRLHVKNLSNETRRGCVHYPRECHFGVDGPILKRCSSATDPCEERDSFELSPGAEIVIGDNLTVPDLNVGRTVLSCWFRIVDVGVDRVPIEGSVESFSVPEVELEIGQGPQQSEP